MNRIEAFQASVAREEAPPADLGAALKALWWDMKGDWHRAHEATQDDAGTDVSWVHAYLHRKEGDLSTAGYWYGRAAKPVGEGGLDEERDAILGELLRPD